MIHVRSLKRSLGWLWVAGLAVGLNVVQVPSANALDLDWSGQFRTDFHALFDYDLGQNATDGFNLGRYQREGYYIPGGGEGNATFQSLFLELRPKVIVNDNIFIKSEWWVGDPIFGMFGTGTPNTNDRRAFNSSYSAGSSISAQRLWIELQSDLGTFSIGRQPLHYGLGVVWNAGDGLWDRYQSTGDAFRLISKFGAFTLSPSFITYSMGPNVGGSCEGYTSGAGPTCQGKAGINEYSLLLKYESPEQDFDAGMNFMRRIAGRNSTSFGFLSPIPQAGTGFFNYTGVPGGFFYNVFDFYLMRRVGRLNFAMELPLIEGSMGGVPYSTWALATEVKWDISDAWATSIKAGRSPGQQGSTGSSTPDRYALMPFHHAYRLGMIMFQYQLANLAGPNNPNALGAGEALRSPFDNPVLNANYFQWNGAFSTEKWTFDLSFLIATAVQAAQSGQHFYNTWSRRMSSVPAVGTQDKFLGWELDTGATFRWDDNFIFRWELGLYKPGDYYRFSNVVGSPNDNTLSTLFATAFKVGVNF